MNDGIDPVSSRGDNLKQLQININFIYVHVCYEEKLRPVSDTVGFVHLGGAIIHVHIEIPSYRAAISFSLMKPLLLPVLNLVV